jgi:hypothetical protein
LAVFAADFIGAGATLLAADFVRDAVALPLAGDFPEPLDFAVAVALRGLLEAVVRDAPFEVDFAPETRERVDAVTAPAPFFFSLFLADGIRRTLLLHPAVETGRIVQIPCGAKGRTALAGEITDLAPELEARTMSGYGRCGQARAFHAARQVILLAPAGEAFITNTHNTSEYKNQRQPPSQ